MAARIPVIALTAGEPAGIGPDLCVLAARERYPGRLVVLGDPTVLASRARSRNVPFDIPAYDRAGTAPVSLLAIPAATAVHAGKLDPANGRHVVAILDRAIDGCRSGEFDAMVTAPVQKSTINDAGVPFTGHTEYLAERTGTKRVVMMLVGGGLRVALATTHLALSEVPRALTRELLEETLRILERDLRERFGIAKPRILVAGLNPHAGESGYLGREEIDVIAPVIDSLAREGLDVKGPFPADTLYTPKVLEGGDATLAMFHDQGLPVLKHASFGRGVNVTLGLPIVRTSVDHGTALELAGTGRAEHASLEAALEAAAAMVRHG